MEELSSPTRVTALHLRVGCRFLRAFGAATALALTLTSCASGLGFEPTERAVLERAEHGEIFALNPVPPEPEEVAKAPGELFQGYRVLGKAKLTSKEERDRLIEAVRDAIRSNDGTAAKCFTPRHGLRIVAQGDAVDLVICFECYQMRVHQGPNEHMLLIGRDGESELDAALARHQLPKHP